MKTLAAAVAMLTRIPVPGNIDAADVGRGAAWFPLVGAAVGAVQLAALWVCAATPMPPALSALALLTVAWWLTGAIHLDGLADLADSAGGRTRADALRILSEPALGTYGVTAIVLIAAVKAVSIATLITRDAAVAPLLVGPTVARWSMVMLGVSLPYAKPAGGLGTVLSDHTRWRHAAVASATALLLTAPLGGITVAAMWIATVAVTSMMWKYARRRLGGFTGDVIGANAELSETAVYLTAVVFRC